MRIAIVGLGLIGGSMAIDLKRRGFAEKIIGVDRNVLHAETALRLGLVDELDDLTGALKKTDLMILAIPANETMLLLPELLDQVGHQILTDVCSVKSRLCELVKDHPKRSNFVAAHPMAGTEHSGPWAAQSDLYDGKAVIFCDVEGSSTEAVHKVEALYRTLNMRFLYMNSVNHDVHAAYVSHISHISSFALALTVLDKEKNEKNIFDLASGGFDSTVRLAKSSSDMWTSVFLNNASNVQEVIKTYIKKLTLFSEAIAQSESQEITNLIKQANRIKKII